MLSAGIWSRNQPNTVLFVLIDASGNEVSGLGSSFTLQLSKAGAAFSGSAGTKSEISDGWYKYISTVGEADTPGPIAIRITGAGIIQQNLEYVVENRVELAVEFTYTVTNSVSSMPIEGVDIAIYGDSAAANIVWTGRTDVNGVARDSYGQLPRLIPATYYIWRTRSGFSFVNPDTETVDV